MEALGINLPFLLVQIVNLLIVYTVVAKWVVAPIGGMLDKRRETIAQGMEDARVASEARANAEEEAARIRLKHKLKPARSSVMQLGVPRPLAKMSRLLLKQKLPKPLKKRSQMLKQSAIRCLVIFVDKLPLLRLLVPRN